MRCLYGRLNQALLSRLGFKEALKRSFKAVLKDFAIALAIDQSHVAAHPVSSHIPAPCCQKKRECGDLKLADGLRRSGTEAQWMQFGKISNPKRKQNEGSLRNSIIASHMDSNGVDSGEHMRQTHPNEHL